MKTAQQMHARIGTHVILEPVRGLAVRCRVTDAKVSYGTPRLEIEAIEGEGKAWVNASTVKPVYGPSAPKRASFAAKEGE